MTEPRLLPPVGAVPLDPGDSIVAAGLVRGETGTLMDAPGPVSSPPAGASLPDLRASGAPSAQPVVRGSGG